MNKLTAFHHLQQAEHHVLAGVHSIKRQRRLIGELEAKNLDTQSARILLAQLEELQTDRL
jgi:hypothetical protein